MAQINVNFNPNQSLFCDLRSGLTIEVRNQIDWFLVQEIFINREYEHAFPNLSEAPNPANKAHHDNPFKVVDLGANVGYFTLWVANELINFGCDFDITCIEGSHENVLELVRRFHSQPTSKLVNKVSIHEAIIGEREGSVRFFKPEAYHSLNCVMHSTQQRLMPGKAIEALYTDISPLIPLGIIDLLKIDIEQSEELFLKTYPDILKRTKRIVIEFHHDYVTMKTCEACLQQAGFTRVNAVPKGNVSVEVWDSHVL